MAKQDWSPRRRKTPLLEGVVSCRVRGKVKVEISWLGEGVQGDYDARDPEDVPVLRVDVYSLATGADPEEAIFSYATAMSAWLGRDVVRSVACELAKTLSKSEGSWTRLVEEFTWHGDDDAYDIHQGRAAAR